MKHIRRIIPALDGVQLPSELYFPWRDLNSMICPVLSMARRALAMGTVDTGGLLYRRATDILPFGGYRVWSDGSSIRHQTCLCTTVS